MRRVLNARCSEEVPLCMAGSTTAPAPAPLAITDSAWRSASRADSLSSVEGRLTPKQRATWFVLLSTLGLLAVNGAFLMMAFGFPGLVLLPVGVVLLIVATGWTGNGRVGRESLHAAGAQLGWSAARTRAVSAAVQGLAMGILGSAVVYLFRS